MTSQWPSQTLAAQIEGLASAIATGAKTKREAIDQLVEDWPMSRFAAIDLLNRSLAGKPVEEDADG